MARKKKDPEYPHIEFSKRLVSTCEAHPSVPAKFHGTYIWILNQLAERFDVHVTKESVRKWFIGEALPRDKKLRALATLLGVDEGWLAFGHTLNVEPSKRNVKLLSNNGAVTLVAGMIQLAGGFCAFPEPDDQNDFVDIYVIVDQRQRMISIARGYEIPRDKVRFEIKTSHEKAMVLGLIQNDFSSFDVLHIPTEIIEAHGQNRGPYIELTVTLCDKGWQVGRSKLVLIEDFKVDLRIGT